MKPTTKAASRFAVVMLAMLLLCVHGPFGTTLDALAQAVDETGTFLAEGLRQAPGVCGLAGDFGVGGVPDFFEIDGAFYSGDWTDPGPGDDWAQGPDPTYYGVIDDFGVPDTLNFRPISWKRDPHALAGATDATAFHQSCKNNHDISEGSPEVWNWHDGNVNAKDDLTELYAHARIIGTGAEREVWLIMGAGRIANEGASHIDFEWNLEGVEQRPPNPQGIGEIVGLGPHAGRSVGFDFIATVDLENGGREVFIELREWIDNAGEYMFSDPLDPLDLEGHYYLCVNQEMVVAPPWGATNSDGVVVYEPDMVDVRLFSELGINATALGFLMPEDFDELCTGRSTLMVKTRSSPSFTADLKDFGLLPLPIFEPPPCTITSNPICVGDTADVCGPTPPTPGQYSYHWTMPNGSDYPDTTAECIEFTTMVGGTYTFELWVYDLISGCASEPCDYDLTVYPEPNCDVDGITAICYSDIGISHGGYLDYALTNCSRPLDTTSCEWSFTSNTAGAVIVDPSSCPISVSVTGPGEFTLHVDYLSTDGCPGEEDLHVEVFDDPVCTVEGDEGLCFDSDAAPMMRSYTMNCTGSRISIDRWEWQVTSGGGIASIFGAADGQSVQVQITGSGQFTLRCDAYDDHDVVGGTVTCSDWDDIIVDVYPEIVCSISGADAFCAPLVGTTVTETYNLSCGTLESPEYTWGISASPGGSATIVAGGGTSDTYADVQVSPDCDSYTVSCDIDDVHAFDTCEGYAEFPVDVFPNPDCDIDGPEAFCFVGTATKTYTMVCLSDPDPGGTRSYSWTEVSDPSGIATILSATGNPTSVQVSGDGTFTIGCTVSDDYVDDICTTYDEIVVNVYPELDCSIDGDDGFCAPIDGTLTKTYDIDCGDLNNPEFSWALQNVTPPGSVTISGGGGLYDDYVDVDVSPNCESFRVFCDVDDIYPDDTCEGSAFFDVDVYPNPDCTITGTDGVCYEGTPFNEIYTMNCTAGPGAATRTYTWAEFSDPSGIASIISSSGNQATVQISGDGTFTIRCTVDDDYGDGDICSTYDDFTTIVYPEVTCSIDGDAGFCAPLVDPVTKTYTIDCGTLDNPTYAWSLTGVTPGGSAATSGATNSTSVDVVVQPNCESYNVHCEIDDVHAYDTCEGSADYPVVVYPNPDCTITGTDGICYEGEAFTEIYTMNCTSGPGSATRTYTWSEVSDPDGIAEIIATPSNQAQVQITGDGTFTISCLVEDDYGDGDICTTSDNFTTIVYPEVTCTIDGEDAFCAPLVDPVTKTYTIDCGTLDNPTYAWSLTGVTPAGSAATSGATNSTSVDVVVQPNCESYNVHCEIDDVHAYDTCEGSADFPVMVVPTPAVFIDGHEVCLEDVPMHLCGPEAPVGRTYSYLWSIGVPTEPGRDHASMEDRSSVSVPIEPGRNRVPMDQRCFDFDPADFGLGAGQHQINLQVSDVTDDPVICSNSDSRLVCVYGAPTCEITPPAEEPDCGSEGNELTVEFTPPVGADVCTVNEYTYEWSFVEDPPCGFEITGGSDAATVVYTAGGDDECCAMFQAIVTAVYDTVACADTCKIEVCCRPIADEFCSFTKGYYGNYGGTKFGGMTTLEIIQAVLDGDDLVLGVVGTRSLTIGYDAAECIIARLPGGGPNSPLPNFGDEHMATSGDFECLADIDPGEDQLRLKTNGQFENNFLTQMIALSLNIGLYEVHPDIVGHLGDAPLCPYMQTLGAMCGDDGICGSIDDVPVPEDCMNFEIDMAVLEAIDTEFGGGNRDVAHLVMLGNRALAELSTGDATLGQIHDAVSDINEGFDECRFLNYCGDTPSDCPEIIPKGAMIILPDGDGNLTKPIVPESFALAPNAPNPVRTGTSIVYALPEESQISLTIYNVKGQVVDALADGVKPAGYHTIHWDSGSRSDVSAGVYFLRMEAVGAETGETFTKTQKMVVIR